jgi:hypothetical protein
MTTKMQSCVRAAITPIPSFTPVPNCLLQRKCACGGTPGIDGECVACRKKRLGLERRATAQSEAAEARSPGQPLDPGTRAFMEPRFGHAFSRVRVHTNARAADSARVVNALAYTVGPDIAFAPGNYAPGTRAGQSLLAHELTHVVQQAGVARASDILQRASTDDESSATEIEARQMEQAVTSSEGSGTPFGEPNVGSETLEQPEEMVGTAACPITAIFLSTVAGPQKAGCLVAQGMFGASKLAHFRIAGATPGASLTISEKFTAVDDPYNAIGLIQPATYTATNGTFDDCYKLESKNQLPSDFVLKVEQNHLFNGQIISKNHITYRADSVSFCHFDRLPGKCDFGARCKL